MAAVGCSSSPDTCPSPSTSSVMDSAFMRTDDIATRVGSAETRPRRTLDAPCAPAFVPPGDFMAGGGDSLRAILFALGANFAIAVAKGVAAFLSGSSAMVAETVHSLADCGNQLLLLLGLRQARNPPSPDYPLGHGKA